MDYSIMESLHYFAGKRLLFSTSEVVMDQRIPFRKPNK
jgi:hypothetical protein